MPSFSTVWSPKKFSREHPVSFDSVPQGSGPDLVVFLFRLSGCLFLLPWYRSWPSPSLLLTSSVSKSPFVPSMVQRTCCLYWEVCNSYTERKEMGDFRWGNLTILKSLMNHQNQAVSPHEPQRGSAGVMMMMVCHWTYTAGVRGGDVPRMSGMSPDRMSAHTDIPDSFLRCHVHTCLGQTIADNVRGWL